MEYEIDHKNFKDNEIALIDFFEWHLSVRKTVNDRDDKNTRSNNQNRSRRTKRNKKHRQHSQEG